MRTTFSTCNGNEKYRVTSNLRRNRFSHLSELKIMVRPEFDVLYFTLRKFRKYNFPRRTSDLAKTAVKFMASEMDLFPKTRLKKSNKIQLYADIYLLLNYATCFGRPSRPSSGVHKTVVAPSGTDRTIWGASFFKRDQIIFCHV